MNIKCIVRIYVEFQRRLLINENELGAANIKWRLDEAAGQLVLALKKSKQGLHHGL